jgi:hypothetical protein
MKMSQSLGANKAPPTASAFGTSSLGMLSFSTQALKSQPIAYFLKAKSFWFAKLTMKTMLSLRKRPQTPI